MMLDLQTVFTQIFKGLEGVMADHGFNPVYPEGVKKAETPAVKRGKDSLLVNYIGEKAKLRVLYSGSKVFLLAADPETENDEDDGGYSSLSTCLLDLNTYADKDVRFIINELSDTIIENYGKKQLAAQKTRMPTPVSKAAAKSGVLSYDSNTLANRMAANYPELKEPYKKNIEDYGEFLAEDFFINHGNRVILDIIRENNPQKVKKLFGLLNEIYNDGTNEVQSLIVVTILGSIKNDPALIKIVLEHIDDAMMEPVIEVNRILGKSKSVNSRLLNPPVYKPKKKKKGGIMQSLGMQ